MFTITIWDSPYRGILAPSEKEPQRGYSCKAQGASPGLIVEIHLLSPARAALPHGKRSRRKCRSYGALIFCVRVYPGFCSCLWHSRHPGLCGSVVPTALTPAPPNKSDNKRKQRYRTIIRTANGRWGIRPIRREP